MSQEKKLFLLDAMALIYRAYFAFSRNPRINSKGMNTSAIFGFGNALLDVLRNENPTHIGVAFDSREPTQRHTDFAEYKANREDMPEDIESSIPYIIQMIEGFNIPVLMKEGYEADDIIGALSKKAEKKGFEVYMVTPDKDFGQLVSDNIRIYRPSRSGSGVEIIGPNEVCEKYNIESPEQLIDILGLWGDASDNIPGIRGIGEVTAKKLIAEYGSVENLLENSSNIKNPKLRQKIEEGKEQAIISKKLATILLDVPIELDEDQLRTKKPDFKKLEPLFNELEFKTFAKRVMDLKPSKGKDNEEEKETSGAQISMFAGQGFSKEEQENIDKNRMEELKSEKKYRSITDPKEIDNLIKKVRAAKTFCFDTETTGLSIFDNELVGIAFCIQPNEAFYVPFPEDRKKADTLAEQLKDIFEDPKIEKTGQNLKFDTGVLRNYDIEVKGRFFDTMLAHYVLNPDMRHNLETLSETYLDYKPVSIESLIGKKGKNQKSMRSVPVEKQTIYACEDADVTLQLRKVFEPMLEKNEVVKLYNELEIPLIPVLSEMELEGVRIDKQALANFSKKLEKEINEVEKKIYQLAGVKFNIGSPKQLGEILFNKLKIVDKPKKTKTKQFSTSEDVLSKLVNKHEIVSHILDYRSLTKLKSTYVDALPKLINEKSGRIHTSYNQTVAATGRLTSNNPNLQNIPIRTEQGKEIRKAFVARDAEHILLAADYSQIELRIIASISGDKAMIEDFKHGLDIHAATAARVFGVEVNEVTAEMRRKAKTVNFGIIYGISPFGLSERMNIPRSEAEEIINQYFRQYPGIKKYMDDMISFAKKHQYVKTLMDRRRYIKDINSTNSVVRGYGERNAINAPIQGTAADMIKRAMIDIHNDIKSKNLRSKMILQVHDELVFDAYQPELESLKKIVIKRLKNALKLSVPIEIDINTGKNWLEAH